MPLSWEDRYPEDRPPAPVHYLSDDMTPEELADTAAEQRAVRSA